MDGLDAMLKNGPCEDGLSAIVTKLGNPLMLDYYTSDMCIQSWGRSSYARVMIEVRADVELKDNIVVFGHIHEECLKKTSTGEKKTVMKPSQNPRVVTRRMVLEPIIEVSNSNPFDVLNSVDNDGEFGTNSSNTPISEKIDKIERQIYKGKLRLLDNDGNPLVPMGIVESDSEVEVVFNETANLRISTSGKDESEKGYGTNSFLEQLRDSYPDNDDYDPYDDDMYENHDLSEHLQSICDDLHITVRGRKKK
nr:hypothetical protein [Tanacetum cinerariifolium]